VVESGFELGSLVSAGVSDVDPGIEIDHADSVGAAVRRLADRGYDLIVSAEQFDGARTGLFLRHLCARRFPSVPFLLLSEEGHASRAGGLSPGECRQRIKRLL